MSAPTYARARLWTGITGVGSLVVIAAALLAFGVPDRLLGGLGGDALSDALVLLPLLGLAALVALPLDVAGGLVLPRRHGRPHPSGAEFAGAWVRGVSVLLLVSTLSGTLILAAGRWGGRSMRPDASSTPPPGPRWRGSSPRATPAPRAARSRSGPTAA